MSEKASKSTIIHLAESIGYSVGFGFFIAWAILMVGGGGFILSLPFADVISPVLWIGIAFSLVLFPIVRRIRR